MSDRYYNIPISADALRHVEEALTVAIDYRNRVWMHNRAFRAAQTLRDKVREHMTYDALVDSGNAIEDASDE